ncbi:hypothetical protein GG804_13140 [Sphingomonas histidinilytica]|uniref:hypothetical protein n=1 Tax=Rhizorhabdus histidinilytica TaxID=439228 RepID=UPI001ADBD029|nr:hypothetical protein [Rhizorhabdus histidinilytica]MBO9377714.1 hypothetical protein [Rhizorhabdus histidinilytica]
MDGRTPLTLAQIGMVVAVMLGLAFAPPARGRMLLVPLSTRAAAMLPAAAVDGGARLLGAGPFRGSLVIVADRKRLGGVSLADGMIILSAPPLLCGAAEAKGQVT